MEKARQAEILLAAVIIARSTSFLMSKEMLATMGTFNLLAVRFLFAFVILSVIFSKHMYDAIRQDKTLLVKGMFLGGAFFLLATAELMALKTTTTSMTSFIENTAIVFVPIFEAILMRKKMQGSIILSSTITLAGVGLLAFSGGAFAISKGELFCFAAAIIYSIAIIMTDRFSKESDPLTLGVLQSGFLGLFALVISMFIETPRLPSGGFEWSMVAGLAIVCTCFGFTFQAVAQRHITSERAGMFCAINPLATAVIGSIFLNESMNYIGIIGAVLIVAGILIPNMKFSRILQPVSEQHKRQRPTPVTVNVSRLNHRQEHIN